MPRQSAERLHLHNRHQSSLLAPNSSFSLLFRPPPSITAGLTAERTKISSKPRIRHASIFFLLRGRLVIRYKALMDLETSKRGCRHMQLDSYTATLAVTTRKPTQSKAMDCSAANLHTSLPEMDSFSCGLL
jgi:hypothetical protein